MDFIGRRVLTVPNPPMPHTLATAARIREQFGDGGCNFPGAAELYAAADKIEAWAAEWETDDEGKPRGREVTPQQRLGLFSGGELCALWDALTMDDGRRVGLCPCGNEEADPEYLLAVEVLAEADRRGVELPDRWAAER